MKKIFILLLLFVTFAGAHAQFEQGKKYIGSSITGLSLSYSSNEEFRIGLDAEMGYFLTDCFLLKGNIGYEHTRKIDDVRIGASARFFIMQNGIFLGAGAEYNHFSPSNNDVMIPVEIGYCYFLNRHLTIEPSIFYKMSMHDFNGNSTVGLRIGMGFFF